MQKGRDPTVLDCWEKYCLIAITLISTVLVYWNSSDDNPFWHPEYYPVCTDHPDYYFYLEAVMGTGVGTGALSMIPVMSVWLFLPYLNCLLGIKSNRRRRIGARIMLATILMLSFVPYAMNGSSLKNTGLWAGSEFFFVPFFSLDVFLCLQLIFFYRDIG